MLDVHPRDVDLLISELRAAIRLSARWQSTIKIGGQISVSIDSENRFRILGKDEENCDVSIEYSADEIDCLIGILQKAQNASREREQQRFAHDAAKA